MGWIETGQSTTTTPGPHRSIYTAWRWIGIGCCDLHSLRKWWFNSWTSMRLEAPWPVQVNPCAHPSDPADVSSISSSWFLPLMCKWDVAKASTLVGLEPFLHADVRGQWWSAIASGRPPQPTEVSLESVVKNQLSNMKHLLCVLVSELDLTLTLPSPSAGVSGSLDSYCSIKPLCSGMGEVVPARTSPTLLPPSPRTVLSLSCFKVSQCINCRDWHFKS